MMIREQLRIKRLEVKRVKDAVNHLSPCVVKTAVTMSRIKKRLSINDMSVVIKLLSKGTKEQWKLTSANNIDNDQLAVYCCFDCVKCIIYYQNSNDGYKCQSAKYLDSKNNCVKVIN